VAQAGRRGGLGTERALARHVPSDGIVSHGANSAASVVDPSIGCGEPGGLYVADASTFPVRPSHPMLTVMAMAHRRRRPHGDY